MQNCTTWLPEPALPDLTTDPLQTGWLSERGSLTARLRETWGDVSVEVIEEGLATPLPNEAARLTMHTGETAWVRCVFHRDGASLLLTEAFLDMNTNTPRCTRTT